MRTPLCDRSSFHSLISYTLQSNCKVILLGHFFCVGVVYLGEYDVCDVTLSVYPHRASLKNMPGLEPTTFGILGHVDFSYLFTHVTFCDLLWCSYAPQTPYQ